MHVQHKNMQSYDSARHAKVSGTALTFADINFFQQSITIIILTLTVLVVTIDAQWEGIGDVGAARYEPALLPLCPTIRVLSYSN